MSVTEKVMNISPHIIMGKTVEMKLAQSKEETSNKQEIERQKKLVVKHFSLDTTQGKVSKCKFDFVQNSFRITSTDSERLIQSKSSRKKSPMHSCCSKIHQALKTCSVIAWSISSIVPKLFASGF